MNVWDTYSARINASGSTQRQALLNREKHMLEDKTKNSLSYQSVTIDGVAKNVSIINSDNLNEKTILSLPNETFDSGGIVYWEDNYWLITERDAEDEIYTKAKMVQCNHKLKWVDDTNAIREQWCIVEDGTKYMTGDYEDRDFVVTRGDSRIAMTISRNAYTKKFTRESRFIICDEESDNKLAYALTKPLMVGGIYNGKGVYSFLLSETMTTGDDNLSLCIADYYKHFSKDSEADGDDDSSNSGVSKETAGKRSWL